MKFLAGSFTVISISFSFKNHTFVIPISQAGVFGVFFNFNFCSRDFFFFFSKIEKKYCKKKRSYYVVKFKKNIDHLLNPGFLSKVNSFSAAFPPLFSPLLVILVWKSSLIVNFSYLDSLYMYILYKHFQQILIENACRSCKRVIILFSKAVCIS